MILHYYFNYDNDWNVNQEIFAFLKLIHYEVFFGLNNPISNFTFFVFEYNFGCPPPLSYNVLLCFTHPATVFYNVLLTQLQRFTVFCLPNCSILLCFAYRITVFCNGFPPNYSFCNVSPTHLAE